MTKGGKGSGFSGGDNISHMSEAALRKRADELAEIMEKTAYSAIGYYQKVPGTTKAEHDAYRKAQSEYGDIQNRLMQISRAENQEQKARATSKKFVNSYGEATDRYITSNTYERAMRRQEKAVLQFMGYRH